MEQNNTSTNRSGNHTLYFYLLIGFVGIMTIIGISFFIYGLLSNSNEDRANGDTLHHEELVSEHNLKICDDNKIYARCEDEAEAPVCALIEEKGKLSWRQWKNECQACALHNSEIDKLTTNKIYVIGFQDGICDAEEF